MEEIKIAEFKDLKVGKYVLIDGEPCRVLSTTHSKPGKHGGAKVRVDAIGLFDDQKRVIIGPVNQKIEVPVVNKKTAQVLVAIKDKAQLMDMQSYETFELQIPDELKDKLSEGISVMYLEYGSKRRILQLA
ncbi:MAG: translation initiation factor IF-5A [Candidatus Altiarchaeota archaeon]